MSSAPIIETQALLKDVQGVFETDDDVNLIARVVGLRSETATVVADRNAAMKDLIKTITGRVDTLRGNVEASEAASDIEATLEAKASEKENLAAEVDAANTAVGTLEERLAAAQNDMLGLRAEKAALSKKHAADVPRAVNAMGLFANLSSIEWDLTSPETVKGNIQTPDGEVVKPFNLDPSAHTMYFITNFLWDMIPDNN